MRSFLDWVRGVPVSQFKGAMDGYKAAKKVVVDDITFASKREARRYGDLKMLERAGKISGLVVHGRHKIVIDGALICTYISDFEYLDLERNVSVVEDVKPSGNRRDRVFEIKRKLMKAVHCIDVDVVRMD